MHLSRICTSEVNMQLMTEFREALLKMYEQFAAVDRRLDDVNKHFEDENKRFEDMHRQTALIFRLITIGFVILGVITTLFQVI